MRCSAMILMLAPMLALPACAPTAAQRQQADDAAARRQSRLDRALAGLVPGESGTCLPAIRQTSTQGYGPTIIYRVTNGLQYRTDTSGGCEGIERGDILVTRSTTGNLCRGDIAITLDPVSRFQTGSCSLGDFVPYRKP